MKEQFKKKNSVETQLEISKNRGQSIKQDSPIKDFDLNEKEKKDCNLTTSQIDTIQLRISPKYHLRYFFLYRDTIPLFF